jgi:hypothetical protein
MIRLLISFAPSIKAAAIRPASQTCVKKQKLLRQPNDLATGPEIGNLVETGSPPPAT